MEITSLFQLFAMCDKLATEATHDPAVVLTLKLLLILVEGGDVQITSNATHSLTALRDRLGTDHFLLVTFED